MYRFKHPADHATSIFFLFTSAMTWTMKTVFRAIAAAFDSPAPAQSVAGVVFLGAAFYTGYTLPKPSMIGALRWLTYINVSVVVASTIQGELLTSL